MAVAQIEVSAAIVESAAVVVKLLDFKFCHPVAVAVHPLHLTIAIDEPYSISCLYKSRNARLGQSVFAGKVLCLAVRRVVDGESLLSSNEHLPRRLVPIERRDLLPIDHVGRWECLACFSRYSAYSSLGSCPHISLTVNSKADDKVVGESVGRIESTGDFEILCRGRCQ